tara:strand:- start:1868 stop:2083 length:216 start_codon:yes stop_codon:yes gene_type:complete
MNKEPKFKKGQIVLFKGKEMIINSVNIKRYPIIKNNRTTGFEDIFTGSYFCSSFDNNESDNIEESLLSKPS